MKLKVVSFKVCPFVQRVLIVLQYKGIKYDVEYIDLASPPEWFLAISPLKLVPLLIVDDEVIFESSVINEYIEETYDVKMHPINPIEKAHNRSWIEFGSSISMCTFRLTILQKKSEFNDALIELVDYFNQVEKVLVNEPFFNGDKLSLVDATYAPAFQRIDFIEQIYGSIYDKKRHIRVINWKNRLLDIEHLKKSAVPELKDLYYKLLWTRQGYISQFLDEKIYGKRDIQSMY
jgi:glutathione S-transferase